MKEKCSKRSRDDENAPPTHKNSTPEYFNENQYRKCEIYSLKKLKIRLKRRRRITQLSLLLINFSFFLLID